MSEGEYSEEYSYTNCKNCATELSKDAKYCQTCGAKVIRERLTAKSVIKEMIKKIFVWDNKYFFTVKELIVRPEVVFKEYLGGVRKKYLHPVTFLMVGAAIALILFNRYSDEYVALSNGFNESEFNWIEDVLPHHKRYKGDSIQIVTDSITGVVDSIPVNIDSLEQIAFEEYKVEQLEGNEKAQRMILKYFNLFTLFILPFYALLAFLTFRKPYNYGEHFVITAFIQGLTFVSTTIFFLLSVFVHPTFYIASILLTIFYYSYFYTRLYKRSFGWAVLRFLKFIGFLLLIMLGFFIAGVISVIIYKVAGG